MEGGVSNLTKLRKPDEDGGSMKDSLVIELLIISLIVILFLLIGVVLIGRMYLSVVAIQLPVHVVDMLGQNVKAIRTAFAGLLGYSGLYKS